MSIKYFCDRCGAETEEGSVYALPALDLASPRLENGPGSIIRPTLCVRCRAELEEWAKSPVDHKELMTEHEFRVALAEIIKASVWYEKSPASAFERCQKLVKRLLASGAPRP